MTRTRLTTLLATAALATGLVSVPAATADKADPQCRWAIRGHAVNRWLGGTGSWNDPARWSRAKVPGITGRSDYACIPDGSAVVVDDPSSRVDLEILELGRGSRLTLLPGTALYVWGNQDQVRSVTKRESVMEVDGATLGGAGVLHVIGTLDVHASSGGSPATLTSRPVASSVEGRAGILEIGDDGTLDVTGDSDVRLAQEYAVDVHGRARLRDDAGLVADHGTVFLLQRRYFGPGVGRLVVTNDRGFAEGAPAGVEELATFVNRGRIVKRGSNGTSHVVARYLAGDFVEKSGHLDLPPGITQEPPVVACSATDPCDDAQTADLEVPVTDVDGITKLVSEPLDGQPVAGAVGVPMQVHASGLQATIADPAIIEMDYDASLFQEAGAPTNPARLTVAHADDTDTTYAAIPVCGGNGSIPWGAFACLDLTKSHKQSDGDVVLVVLTTDTSRWIVRP